MPAKIYGRHILPKFRFPFMKNLNIHNSLLWVRATFPDGGSNVPQRLGWMVKNYFIPPAETPPDKVILTITRAMQGMSHCMANLCFIL